MHKIALPDEFKAEWIWVVEPRRKQETYLFFRKEFTLDEIPSSAELWITARSLFHLYLNGRHVTFGPAQSPVADQSYILCLDITYLLETGLNNISVLAYNTSITRFSTKRQPDGFLAQLNINNKPFLWTNNTWTAIPALCYGENRPRRSLSAGFTEKLDFHFYPTGWDGKEFNLLRARHGLIFTPLKSPSKELTILAVPDFISMWESFASISAGGYCRQVAVTTHVSFQSLIHDRGPGVFSAESYIFSGRANVEIPFTLISDDPCKFFCNGQCVKEQRVTTLPAGIDVESAGAFCLRHGETVSPDGQLILKEGWNHLVVCQLLNWGSPGFTLILPGISPEEIHLCREPSGEDTPGWALTGPLRAPLANITGSLNLADLGKLPFVSDVMAPVDEGANLLGYEFYPDSTKAGYIPERIDLRQGEFVVFDLGRILYGCPAFSASGSDNDAIDIVCGEILEGSHVAPYHASRQNVDSLVLAPRLCRWQACAPRGLRYLMLVGRNVHSTVQITDIMVCRRQYDVENAGRFQSGDPILNRIWEISARTLEVTLQDVFMDSACKENAQYIPDAMIQALTSFYTLGSSDLSAKGLQDFAMAQIETGELPAVCPSDSYVNIPDYALLWPVWLHRHYLYSGNLALFQKLLPTLRKLLGYFAFIENDRHLLADLDLRFGAPCFLDHGEIDRQGIVTGLNAIYCRALLSSAWLMEQAGCPEEGEPLKHKAARIGRHLRELVWNSDQGWFADSWHDGAPSPTACWQTNLLALYGGLADPSEYSGIFEKIFIGEPPFLQVGATAELNPYFNFFVLETALALGYRTWAMDFIRWYWGGMLERGANTWWELFNPEDENGTTGEGSRCHGYGVSPGHFLLAELVGIRPAKPGFSSVIFNPILSQLTEVKAEIPTPYGKITINWQFHEGRELEVNISSNYPLEVIPVLDPEIAASATFHVSDEVSILTAGGEGVEVESPTAPTEA